MAKLAALLAVIALALLGCSDDSGVAHRIGPARPSAAARLASSGSSDKAAPDDGGPTCDEVAAHLAAGAGPPQTGRIAAGGGTVEVKLDLAEATRGAIASLCRDEAWSRPQRSCALAYQGNVLTGASAFHDACLERAR